MGFHAIFPWLGNGTLFRQMLDTVLLKHKDIWNLYIFSYIKNNGGNVRSDMNKYAFSFSVNDVYRKWKKYVMLLR